jgi:hypothetical protein
MVFIAEMLKFSSKERYMQKLLITGVSGFLGWQW